MPEKFILLSSAGTVRYKQDILRALAMPKGAMLQFRYEKKYISADVLARMEATPAQVLGPALICFLDNSVTIEGKPLRPLIPVRDVRINRVRNLDESVTVEIEAVDYVTTPNSNSNDRKEAIARFTQSINQLSGSQSPRFEGGIGSGRLFFSITVNGDSDLPIERGNQLRIWQHAVNNLLTSKQFEEEPFFYSVLGLREAGEDSNAMEKLEPWPKKIGASSDLRLQIYHYSPKKAPMAGVLKLITGSPITLRTRPDLCVDSRYDLKYWMIQTDNQSFKEKGCWLGIQSGDAWSLDLNTQIKGAWLRNILVLIFIALTFAVPKYIENGTLQSSLPSLISGALAGAAIIFGLQKVKE